MKFLFYDIMIFTLKSKLNRVVRVLLIKTLSAKNEFSFVSTTRVISGFLFFTLKKQI